MPAAVVVTVRDRSVPPSHQRELAALLGAATFEVDGDHGAAVTTPQHFNPALLRALEAVARPAATVAA